MKITYLGPDIGYNAIVSEFGTLVELVHTDSTTSSVKKDLSDSDALIDASMKVKITDEMIKESPHLKIISCATTGSDHIEKTEIDKRGIPIRTLREDRDILINLTPAAEHSWALLISCARKIPSAFDHVKSGGWNREFFPGIMLKGKRIGIIGCGRIGSWMGRYAYAFGMEIWGYDPYVNPLSENFTKVTLTELMRECNFISIHVHLNKETKGLISKECFDIVKHGAVLINTSRGAVVDQDALLESLNNGRLSAAGLDVLEGEPDIDHNPLVEHARNHDNLIITPHCGGFSPEAVALVCVHAAGKVIKSLGINS